MGQVLYRKYRSRAFDEVIGQDHIVSTLQKALEQGQISHAYLFTGPRGVGKTSVARILAHDINKLPYNDDGTTHLDIIEIDAASNRRIDEIRDLREKVHLAPAQAPYKVYIVDEVHMLTTEAFNALLKTLEEPPQHVIFILATTEAHKVPETIVSRTQRFAFRPIEAKTMLTPLKDISKKENLQIDTEALSLIAEHARGSFRDALSLLDQIRTQPPPIDATTVEAVLGLPPSEQIKKLFGAFEHGQLRNAFEILETILLGGAHPQTIARSLSKLARDKILDDQNKLSTYLPLIERLLEVEHSLEPLLHLEAALAATLPTPSPEQSEERSIPEVTEQPEGVASEVIEEEPRMAQVEEPIAPKSAKDFAWNELVEKSRQDNQPLHALLRMAVGEYDPKTNVLNLRFRFAFHAKRLNSSKQLTLLQQVLLELFGLTPEINVVHDSTATAPSDAGATLKQVADILGGEVVDL